MNLSRRSFLNTIVGGVAAGAAVRTWPFRVFSFPTEIVVPGGFGFSIPPGVTLLGISMAMNKAYHKAIQDQFQIESDMVMFMTDGTITTQSSKIRVPISYSRLK